MELHKVNILNKGMSQDVSISKDSQEFAFENRNIRIQALDDGTLLSITNVKGPVEHKEVTLYGKIVAKCIAGKYLVVFTSEENPKKKSNTDRIYRIDLKGLDSTGKVVCKLLFVGTLHFELDRPFDTLYYSEGSKVQKVYWTEAWYSDKEMEEHRSAHPSHTFKNNSPRVINIITPKERNTGTEDKYTRASSFEFYPEIDKLPRFNILKTHDANSQLPSGTIQYFASYYNYNGAETLIANSSAGYTLDYATRGATAEETGTCSFQIKMSNLDTNFDYCRIYSAIRTSLEGPLTVKIVGDIKIDKDHPERVYQLLDNGINQEQLEAGQLYFIGGTPFFAKTLTSKDNTAFFGNIKTDPISLPKELVDAIQATITHVIDKKDKYKGDPETKTPELIDTIIQDEHFWSKLVSFTRCDKSSNYQDYKNTKGVPLVPNQFSEFYPYRLQTSNSSISYKTFKGGEIYRFGIQFQSKKGQWSPVVWIGDKECTSYNDMNEVNEMALLNNATFTFPKEILALCKSIGFSNYRIVIADPETQNGRKVQAQGVVCPTMFAPGQRALKSAYAIPSWIMRPRKAPIAYHHFEPPFAASTDYSEIAAYDPYPWYSAPFFWESKDTLDVPEYLVTVFGINAGHIICTKSTKVKSACSHNSFYNEKGDPDPLLADLVTIWEPHDDEDGGSAKKKYWNATSWNKVVDHWQNKYTANNVDTRFIPSLDTLKTMGKNDFMEDFLVVIAIIAAIVVAVLGWVLSIYTAGTTAWACTFCAELIAAAGLAAAAAYAGKSICEQYKLLGLTYSEIQELAKTYGDLDSWQKDLVGKGFFCVGRGKDALKYFSDSKQAYWLDINHRDGKVSKQQLTTIPTAFKPDGLEDMLDSHSDTIVYVQCVPISSVSYYAKEIRDEMNQFYVDESIVTFHSPEIDTNPSLMNNKNLKFRVIGAVPIDNSYADFELQTETAGFIKDASVEYSAMLSHRNVGAYDPMTSGFLYMDSSWFGNSGAASGDYDGDQENGVLSGAAGLYKLHLWDSNGSIIGATEHTMYGDNEIGYIPCKMKSKTFFNHSFCKGVRYFNSPIEYAPSRIKVATGDGTALSIESEEPMLYTPNYDTLIVPKDPINTYIKDAGTQVAMVKGKRKRESVRLKFDSTPHAVFALSNDRLNYREILPDFENSLNKYLGVNKCGKYTVGRGWEKTTHSQKAKACWTTEIPQYSSDKYFVYIYEKFKGVINPINAQYSSDPVPQAPPETQIGKKEFKDHLLSVLFQRTNFAMLAKYAEEGKALIGIDYEVDKGHWFSRPIRHKLKITKIVLERGASNGYLLKEFEFEEVDGGKEVDCLSEEVYIDRFQYGSTPFTFTKKSGKVAYNGFPIVYNQKIIKQEEPMKPYLFLGELYYDTKHKDLYGGFSEDNMKNLIWYPVSPITPIGEDVTTMEGDTYYQRYDCLKTVPATEEDTNKVVDITSFMVESHVNLDARTDLNRGKFNIMSRPTNFNLFNPVYSGKNNIFQYTVDYNDLGDTEHPTQFSWSLVKNTLAEVDSWTNVSLAAISSCDYPITKLLTYNNVVLGLTEGSLEQINFNAKGLVPSSDNTFIEIASSSKVDGTTRLQFPYGSFNSSVLITEKGLYFIDDNERSIIRMNNSEGVTKVGVGKLDHWFKNTIKKGTNTQTNKQPFHLEYDPIHKDVYILNEDHCLIYNESLESFTSFMDSSACNTLFPLGGDLFALANGYTGVFEMFAGEYNRTFGDKVTDYSVHYRVNPAPYSDKVFTNVEFIADCFNPTLQAGEKPFDTIQAWNEYQNTGVKPLIFDRHVPSSLKQKFRIWRADIPRDQQSRYGRDRIRNPWVNLKLTKHNTEDDKSKLELHSMNVQYML